MSTNYFLIRKNTRESRKLVEQKLISGDYDNAIRLIEEMNEGIHIGSSSANWKFAVEYHDGLYFEKNRESFIKWLRESLESGDYIIRDENGWEYKFISEIEKLINSEKEGLTMKEYSELHPNEPMYYKPDDWEEIIDDIRFINHWFR